MKPIGMFLAFFGVARVFIPTASGSVDTQAVGLAFEEIAPPPEEVHTIRLCRKQREPEPRDVVENARDKIATVVA